MAATTPRVLILGGDGMLGHKAFQLLSQHLDVTATMRLPDGPWRRIPLYDDQTRIITGVNALDFDSVTRALAETRPDVVLNCIGIVKQLRDAHDHVLSITINALFPHRLANLCAAAGARLIHISTDCVFSGRRGRYTEDDVTDAEDLYGRTKLLGEVDRVGALTLRTSIIGRELGKATGLLEWFLGNRGGSVAGYRNHIYTGFTTAALAGIIETVITDHPGLSGLYQVASVPIDKCTLLERIRDHMNLNIAITPSEPAPIDRSMLADRFVKETGMSLPGWDTMIAELAADPTPYDTWRQL